MAQRPGRPRRKLLLFDEPLYTAKVGTWYELWYPHVGAETVNVGPQNGWNTGRFVSLLGKYNSDDPSIYEVHRRMFKEAGVDFLVIDATNHDVLQGNARVYENTKRFMDFMDAKPPAERVPIALGIGSWFYDPTKGPNPSSEANVIWEELVHRPSYFRVDGKPLLVNYAQRNCCWNWDDGRFFVGLGYGRMSEFLTDYTGPDARKRFEGRGLWGWVADAVLDNGMEVHVIPGYDRTRLDSRAQPVPRGAHGETLQRQFLQAIAATPRHITVGCFNDFSEETSLEPGVFDPSLPLAMHEPYQAYARDYKGSETPDWYWQIFRAYSLLRWGLEEGTYYGELGRDDVYAVERGHLVYKGEPADHRPFIWLPAGTLRKFLRQQIARSSRKREHDILSLAAKARWTDNTGSVPFGQPTSTNRGEARLVPASVTQDGNTVPKGLFTHPAWQDDGFIEGQFEFFIPRGQRAYFTTFVGLLRSAEGSDGVRFEVHAGDQHAFLPIKYDRGTVQDLLLDLGPAAGQRRLSLKVTTLGNSQYDHALWIDSKIIMCR